MTRLPDRGGRRLLLQPRAAVRPLLNKQSLCQFFHLSTRSVGNMMKMLTRPASPAKSFPAPTSKEFLQTPGSVPSLERAFPFAGVEDGGFFPQRRLLSSLPAAERVEVLNKDAQPHR